MPIATAPALLIGLGARIILDLLSRSEEASFKDFILIGAWQGVALHYALKNSALAIPVAFGIAAKLFIEFNIVPDLTRCITTVLGVVLGVVANEFLSQVFGQPPEPERRHKKTHASTPSKHEKKRDRLVQFRDSVQGGSVDTVVPLRNTIISDITSIDSNSEIIGPKSFMSPLEREVAALRARASLADSERRRYKEERKWAISQGNLARAAQMKWQVKRYTALMQSFHREADAKVLAGSGGRPTRQSRLNEEAMVASSSSTEKGKTRQRGDSSASNEQLPTPTSSVVKERSVRPRDSSNGYTSVPRGEGRSHTRRASTSKQISRDAVR